MVDTKFEDQKMFRKTIAVAAVGTILAGCATTTTTTKATTAMVTRSVESVGNVQYSSGLDFIPVEPIPAETVVKISEKNVLVDRDIRLLSKAQRLALLADTRSKITVAKKDDQGKLTYLTGMLTAERGSYVAIMDFANFFVDTLYDVNGDRIGDARIGVGLRLVANIKTLRSGIDIGSILKIGFAASRNELRGDMEVRAIGLTSQEILSLLPGIMPSINESSIQSALEAMAAVKAKIYEDDTVVAPRVLAIKFDPAVVGKPVQLRIEPVDS